jgi:hypothetical protein
LLSSSTFMISSSASTIGNYSAFWTTSNNGFSLS